MALTGNGNHYFIVPALAGLGAVTFGVYAGAALYSTVVEQKAWTELADPDAAHKVFTKTIWKAAALQGVLAVVGGGSTLGAYFLQEKRDVRLLAAGGLVLSMWPYTMAFIMPINNTLTTEESHKQPSSWKADHLTRWDSFHKARTAAGLVAFGTLVWSLADM